MFFTSPLAQASSNSAFEISPLPSLSTCVKLTMNGAAADFASRSPDGTAFFQIAAHCSGFRAAEGRPDVMVFACASAQVAVNGSTTREMMNALNICLLLVLAKCVSSWFLPSASYHAAGGHSPRQNCFASKCNVIGLQCPLDIFACWPKLDITTQSAHLR